MVSFWLSLHPNGVSDDFRVIKKGPRITQEKPVALFAVYDGHVGPKWRGFRSGNGFRGVIGLQYIYILYIYIYISLSIKYIYIYIYKLLCILGTRELGLVKDTPGWTSPISSCAGPPLHKSQLIRCPSENRNYVWFFWFAEKYWFFQESSAAWTARKSWWPRNELIKIY